MQKIIPLGKKTPYIDTYSPDLLFPIDRIPSREALQAGSPLPKGISKGFDLWNCYEFSMLSRLGKPKVGILEFFVPADSPRITESKSVKLYLNSFNNTRFDSEEDAAAIIKRDLSSATGSEIFLSLKPLTEYGKQVLSSFSGESIDEQEIEIEQYSPSPNLLEVENETVSERLTSDLLKSNCLVTGQPDWGSILIEYEGKKLNRASLLKYIVSFRNCNEFAEPLVEKIFFDLSLRTAPSSLTVYARFTRRGGIDINPIRSTRDLNITHIDNFRHIRQ